MKRLTFQQLLVLSVAMAIAGGWLYVRFRAWRGEEEPYFLFLIAICIGNAVGRLADYDINRRLVLLIAVLSTVGACVVGTLWIAVLEREAIVIEFDRDALHSDDFFVALEAYRAKDWPAGSSPPFTEVAGRQHFSDTEWGEAQQRWVNRPENEKEQIRHNWRADYAKLEEIGQHGIVAVFIAPWHLVVYVISAAIAAGTVSYCMHRRGDSGAI